MRFTPRCLWPGSREEIQQRKGASDEKICFNELIESFNVEGPVVVGPSFLQKDN